MGRTLSSRNVAARSLVAALVLALLVGTVPDTARAGNCPSPRDDFAALQGVLGAGGARGRYVLSFANGSSLAFSFGRDLSAHLGHSVTAWSLGTPPRVRVTAVVPRGGDVIYPDPRLDALKTFDSRTLAALLEKSYPDWARWGLPAPSHFGSHEFLLRVYPDFVLALHIATRIEEARGGQAALAVADAALASYGDFDWVRLYVPAALHRRGMHREARARLVPHLVESAPLRAHAYRLRARVLEALGEPRAALSDLNYAVTLNPWLDDRTYADIARLRAATGTRSPGAAVFVCGRAVEGGPVAEEAGRTLVPLRAASEALGARVHWDARRQAAVVALGDARAEVRVGQRRARAGGRELTLLVPPRLVGGRLLVPVRLFAEALGADVRELRGGGGRVIVVREGGG